MTNEKSEKKKEIKEPRANFPTPTLAIDALIENEEQNWKQKKKNPITMDNSVTS